MSKEPFDRNHSSTIRLGVDMFPSLAVGVRLQLQLVKRDGTNLIRSPRRIGELRRYLRTLGVIKRGVMAGSRHWKHGNQRAVDGCI